MRRRGTHRLGLIVAGTLMVAVACTGRGADSTSSAPPSVGSGGPTASAGATPAPPSGTSEPADWAMYQRDAQRSGYDPGMPEVGRLARAWAATLDGAVYAEPLVVGGHIIAATEHDTVYSLDAATGLVRWRRHLGTPVPLSQLPCGNIDPLGITGTPVYDAATGHVFVVAEVQRPGGIGHQLFALDASSGAVVGSRSVDPPGSNPSVQQERGALALGNGRVYVPFGGLFGDCGDYHGYVVGAPTGLAGDLAVYSPVQTVTGAARGGIWAAPGPVIDGSGNLYVALGNGRTSPPFDSSDSVIDLSPSLGVLDFFAPSEWAQDNASDLDLGSTSPALAGPYVYAEGKSGVAYLLRRGNLGHIGGQIANADVCAAFGADAVVGTTIFVPCVDGIRAVDVAGGSIEVTWHTPVRGAVGPPVVGGGTVWSVGIEDGVLYALDQRTGEKAASIPVGRVEHFATPTLWNGLVMVPAATGVVSVRGG